MERIQNLLGAISEQLFSEKLTRWKFLRYGHNYRNPVIMDIIHSKVSSAFNRVFDSFKSDQKFPRGFLQFNLRDPKYIFSFLQYTVMAMFSPGIF